MSTPRVRAQLQMEYTLKAYAFDCMHTLAYVYKNEVCLGLESQYNQKATSGGEQTEDHGLDL